MKKKQKAKTTAGADTMEKIAESLRGLAVPIGDLCPDPRNARKHDDANIKSIMASLREFGQRKTIVVNREGMEILAGNGTYAAAKRLGWTHLAAEVDDWTPAQAAAFKIADNRTAELAEWDLDILEGMLGEIEDDNPDLFAELLLADLQREEVEETKEEVHDTPKIFQVLVDCKSEWEQDKLLARLEKEGFNCKIVSEGRIGTRGK